MKTAEGKLSEGSNPSLSAIFFALFSNLAKNSSLLLFCKTCWLKGCYNISSSVLETQSDSEIRSFPPGFCLKSVWILIFSEKCKKQGSFCKCLIINEVLYLYLTKHRGSYKNGARFYQSPFLFGKFTLKILTLQTYLVGGRSENAGKFLLKKEFLQFLILWHWTKWEFTLSFSNGRVFFLKLMFFKR